jgi:hypothetical protein
VGDLHETLGTLNLAAEPWQLLTSRVPESYPLWPDADVFVPADMLDLFNLGATWIQQAAPWFPGIPVPGVPPTECLPSIPGTPP